jgi:LemA protein
MEIIILIVAVILIAILVPLYNNLIKTKNSVEENKSSIDTIFQNRYDLIPNLIEVVKKYASHEK